LQRALHEEAVEIEKAAATRKARVGKAEGNAERGDDGGVKEEQEEQEEQRRKLQKEWWQQHAILLKHGHRTIRKFLSASSPYNILGGNFCVLSSRELAPYHRSMQQAVSFACTPTAASSSAVSLACASTAASSKQSPPPAPLTTTLSRQSPSPVPPPQHSASSLLCLHLHRSNK
jgi:hypothetical protein